MNIVTLMNVPALLKVLGLSLDIDQGLHDLVIAKISASENDGNSMRQNFKIKMGELFKVLDSLSKTNESDEFKAQAQKKVLYAIKNRQFFQDDFYDIPKFLNDNGKNFQAFPEAWELIIDELFKKSGDEVNIARLYRFVEGIDGGEVPDDHRVWPLLKDLLLVHTDVEENKHYVSIEVAISVRNIMAKRYHSDFELLKQLEDNVLLLMVSWSTSKRQPLFRLNSKLVPNHLVSKKTHYKQSIFS